MKNKRYYLLLDDVRYPHQIKHVSIPLKPYIIARNYKEFVEIITARGMPEFILYDNDLGEEKEGYDCAKWLVNYCIDNNVKISEWEVISMNPIGKQNINSYLLMYKKHFENAVNS